MKALITGITGFVGSHLVEYILANLPDNILVSEWLHTLGYAKYEYHIHIGETADNLKKLYEQDVRVGNPKLLRLYSKKELKDITQSTLGV